PPRDVRARGQRRRIVDPAPEPGLDRVHGVEGRDGERLQEPLARTGPRGHHRQHRCTRHRDVADPGRVPRRHRPRRAPRGAARGRLRGDRARLRRVERHRPRRPARGGRDDGRVPLLRALQLRRRRDGSRRRRHRLLLSARDRRLLEFNLADLWERVVDAIPEHEAMVCGDRRLTYAEADERANRLAHHLTGLGVGPGDHVALYLSNGTEYLEGMLAAFKLRAVPINVNYRYGADELRYLLADGDARAVVFHREF